VILLPATSRRGRSTLAPTDRKGSCGNSTPDSSKNVPCGVPPQFEPALRQALARKADFPPKGNEIRLRFLLREAPWKPGADRFAIFDKPRIDIYLLSQAGIDRSEDVDLIARQWLLADSMKVQVSFPCSRSHKKGSTLRRLRD